MWTVVKDSADSFIAAYFIVLIIIFIFFGIAMGMQLYQQRKVDILNVQEKIFRWQKVTDNVAIELPDFVSKLKMAHKNIKPPQHLSKSAFDEFKLNLERDTLLQDKFSKIYQFCLNYEVSKEQALELMVHLLNTDRITILDMLRAKLEINDDFVGICLESEHTNLNQTLENPQTYTYNPNHLMDTLKYSKFEPTFMK